MEKLNKFFTILGLTLLINTGIFAQSIPTLELTRLAVPTNSGFGTGILPMTATFQNDAVNDNNFTAYTPAITVTATLQNQTFTGLNYGTGTTAQTTGLVFGAGPTVGGSTTLGAAARNRWDILGAYTGSFGPTDNMFTSNPTATGAQLGTGKKVNTFLNQTNGAFEIFTTAYELYKQNIPITQRVLFGQLKITFSQPVKDPVIDFVGLGGSFRYSVIGLPVNDPNSWRSTFFATELELQNAGVTSTLMSGNQFFSVSGNNILNSNNVNPNGASVNDPGANTPPSFNEYGAATGSVRINGIVQELIYNVYLEGGSGSQFPWAVDKSNILGASSDPFTGDIWYVSASLDRPVLQIISGNVFNDADGLNDNNVSQTLTSVGPVSNPKTNVSGQLFANLVSGGVVVATMPVAANGTFLFDNIAPGSYTVQVSSNQGVVGQPQPATALPAGWVTTGEFNGVGAGNDGLANGVSAPIVVVAGDVKSDINFGIERLPDSKNFTTLITTPLVGETIALNTPSPQRFGNLPILTGSDPEDQPTEAVLTGKTVQFTTLATVGISNTPATLRYNGVDITLNQTITNFNPALLTVFLPSPWAGSGLKFNYAYVDAAGRPDPTPALYQLRWSGGGTLPITLSDFVVTKNNCMASLNWKTSNELNSDRFEIEVSTGANPVYTVASTVLASGSSTSVKSYQFSYPMQAGVVYYFRLKMIDKNGSFTYSTIQSASCSKGSGGITIGPNPATDHFTIRGMQDGKNSVQVYGANGQLVKFQEIQQNQGDVNITHLAPGMYSVKITNLISETTVVLKLIKY